MLCARRGSIALAICPDCSLLVRPIFSESEVGSRDVPSARPEELAAAIVETIGGGARVINISAAAAQPSAKGECALREATWRFVTILSIRP
jgi:hypothetical protein